jgi:EKC/KEOPS complex subunit PCC1/LAGE3
VDAELSPLVQRTFSLASLDDTSGSDQKPNGVTTEPNANGGNGIVFRTEYKATTNRMLRVAVNGFMESLGVVLGVMEELDSDVLEE